MTKRQTMTEKSPRNVSHRTAVERVPRRETLAVTPSCRRPGSDSATRASRLLRRVGRFGRTRDHRLADCWPSARVMRWPATTTTRSPKNSARRAKTPENWISGTVDNPATGSTFRCSAGVRRDTAYHFAEPPTDEARDYILSQWHPWEPVLTGLRGALVALSDRLVHAHRADELAEIGSFGRA